jgi:hypothetical protein
MEEFKSHLKESLEAIDQRISALEHLVNDVIIGGLKDAADEFADDEAYSVFVDTYGDKYKDLEPSMKILNGDGYDMGSDLYERVKSKRDTEGFDELTEVESILNELSSKISAIKAEGAETPEAAADTKEETKEKSDSTKDEDDDLERIFNGE